MHLAYGGRIQVKVRKGGFKGNNQRLIWAFANSGEPCALVEGWKHKNSTVCRHSLLRAITNMNLPHIYAYEHRGKVYLINELM